MLPRKGKAPCTEVPSDDEDELQPRRSAAGQPGSPVASRRASAFASSGQMHKINELQRPRQQQRPSAVPAQCPRRSCDQAKRAKHISAAQRVA